VEVKDLAGIHPGTETKRDDAAGRGPHHEVEAVEHRLSCVGLETGKERRGEDAANTAAVNRQHLEANPRRCRDALLRIDYRAGSLHRTTVSTVAHSPGKRYQEPHESHRPETVRGVVLGGREVAVPPGLGTRPPAVPDDPS